MVFLFWWHCEICQTEGREWLPFSPLYLPWWKECLFPEEFVWHFSRGQSLSISGALLRSSGPIVMSREALQWHEEALQWIQDGWFTKLRRQSPNFWSPASLLWAYCWGILTRTNLIGAYAFKFPSLKICWRSGDAIDVHKIRSFAFHECKQLVHFLFTCAFH